MENGRRAGGSLRGLGYTTFSTWMCETHRFTGGHQHRLATVNLIASIAVDVVATGAGAGQWIGGDP